MEETGYILAKLLFQRGLALMYCVAFLVAINQFIPLLGEHGLQPVQFFVKHIKFWDSPSLFHFVNSDLAFQVVSWVGFVLSLSALSGVSERFGSVVSVVVWVLLWLLYMSLVNVGQTFYSFGWESILLEAGFFAIFLGAAGSQPSTMTIWILRWLLFRIMFGAGMIKLRGDDCWRDLTCLFYHYETQPMPNPLSWYFHWLPQWVHKGGVLFNHFVELIVPFFIFVRQPFASIAGLIIILFQLMLMVSGNFSFLNAVTIVIAFSTLDDATLSYLFHLPRLSAGDALPFFHYSNIVVVVLVLLLSIRPTLNLISPRQIMNTSYNPLHLVGTYGAFGSITRPRYEVIVQGTDEEIVTESSQWKEYEFKGKPGELGYGPRQFAPYHLRLDWLMWFAGFSSYQQHPWFVNMLAKFLQGDQNVLGLIRKNPFPNEPPTYIRAQLYTYEFTTPEERGKTKNTWKRTFVRDYFPPVSLEHEDFRAVLKANGWLK